MERTDPSGIHTVILDAGPLIHLDELDCLFLLADFPKLIVPPSVGKVVETMNAGGYTYVCLENNGKKTWVAIPAAAVKVGQEVKCQPGMEMLNFTSKTLNRTFESIIFSEGIL